MEYTFRLLYTVLLVVFFDHAFEVVLGKVHFEVLVCLKRIEYFGDALVLKLLCIHQFYFGITHSVLSVCYHVLGFVIVLDATILLHPLLLSQQIVI